MATTTKRTAERPDQYERDLIRYRHHLVTSGRYANASVEFMNLHGYLLAPEDAGSELEKIVVNELTAEEKASFYKINDAGCDGAIGSMHQAFLFGVAVGRRVR